MLAYGVSMDEFMRQMIRLVKSVVVKRDEYANKYETVDSKRESDRYIAMIEDGKNWSAYSYFDREVLVQAGLSEELITRVLLGGKDLIPVEFRDLICEYQKIFTLNDYEEMNTYYLMLNGEPPYQEDESNFVYVPENEYNIPTDIPVHQLSAGYLQYINSSPLREELINMYPDKGYLKFLGARSIDYYHARIARNYDILYYEESLNKNISDDFIKQYLAARNYVMIGLYNKADSKMYANYDSFMGFLVMVVAIQKLFHSIFKQGISRNFFDDNLIKELFTAYNFPYISTISIEYQREIAKKLNVLLQKKSTNNVLFDITELFDFSNVDIYKYYLVKDYKKDVNGNPIIIHNTIIDEYGQEHRVIDYEKTFDIYFQRVNIKSNDVTAELANKSNRVEYENIVGNDPYWLSDSSLFNKLYTKKFNNILTKYMSIGVTYDLAKLMYETAHGIRMILDDNEDYKRINITIAGAMEPVSLFDTIVFLCALVAKKFGLRGNIPLKGHQIAQVYGFNFKTDIDALREKVLNDIESCTGEYKKVKLETLKYLNTLNATNLEGAIKMYSNIESLRKFLDDGMRYATDIDEYMGYWKLYRSTLIVEDVEEIYVKNDGTYATTFVELLKDRRLDLYNIYKNITSSSSNSSSDSTDDEVITVLTQEDLFSINNMANNILDKLSQINEKFGDLRFANDKSEIVSNIEKVINQLKSYTVDQTASSIVYLIKDPHLCLLKFICDLITTSKESVMDDVLYLIQTDLLNKVTIRSNEWENIETKYELFYEKYRIINTTFKLLDDIISKIKKYYPISDTYKIYDVISSYYNETFIPILMEIGYDVDEIKYQFSSDGFIFKSDEMLSKFMDVSHKDSTRAYDSISGENKLPFEFIALLHIAYFYIVEVNRLYSEIINLTNRIEYEEKNTFIANCIQTYDFMMFHIIDILKGNLGFSYQEISTKELSLNKDLKVMDYCLSLIDSFGPFERVTFYNILTLGVSSYTIEEKMKIAEEMFSKKFINENSRLKIIECILILTKVFLYDPQINRVMVYDVLFPELVDTDISVKLSVVENFIASIQYNITHIIDFNKALISISKEKDILSYLFAKFDTLDRISQITVLESAVLNDISYSEAKTCFNLSINFNEKVTSYDKRNKIIDVIRMCDVLGKDVSDVYYKDMIKIDDSNYTHKYNLNSEILNLVYKNINKIKSSYINGKMSSNDALSKDVTGISYKDINKMDDSNYTNKYNFDSDVFEFSYLNIDKEKEDDIIDKSSFSDAMNKNAYDININDINKIDDKNDSTIDSIGKNTFEFKDNFGKEKNISYNNLNTLSDSIQKESTIHNYESITFSDSLTKTIIEDSDD